MGSKCSMNHFRPLREEHSISLQGVGTRIQVEDKGAATLKLRQDYRRPGTSLNIKSKISKSLLNKDRLHPIHAALWPGLQRREDEGTPILRHPSRRGRGGR